MLSLSGDGKTHEWTRISAGVFSHQVRSGLLGAADVDADGVITYAEMHAFLAAANRNVQHLQARLHPLVHPPGGNREDPLWEWRAARNRCRLHLGRSDGGRLTLEDQRGIPYLDLNKDLGAPLDLELLPGQQGERTYWVRRSDQAAQVRTGLSCRAIDFAALRFDPAEAQPRGSADSALRDGLFQIPFGPSFYAGFIAAVDADPLPELLAVQATRSRRQLWGYLSLGTALAAVTSGAVLWGLTLRDDRQLAEQLAERMVLTEEDRRLVLRRDQLRIAAAISSGLAVASGVATVVLLWPRPAKPAVTLHLGSLPVLGGGGVLVRVDQ